MQITRSKVKYPTRIRLLISIKKVRMANVIYGKNGFVTVTKLGTTNKIFVAATKNFATATKHFFDRTKYFAVVTKYFCYTYFNK